MIKFNKDGLEFLKKKSKMNKDELFALGFIMGTKATTQSILEGDGASEEVARDTTNQIFDENRVNDLWNAISIKLELETRTLPEIFPDSF